MSGVTGGKSGSRKGVRMSGHGILIEVYIKNIRRV